MITFFLDVLWKTAVCLVGSVSLFLALVLTTGAVRDMGQPEIPVVEISTDSPTPWRTP